ncbi:GNAT family N-acetyltransferase [Micromonospora zhanjiangensis]
MRIPDGWSTRRPTLADQSAILAVLRASELASTGEPDSTLDTVREALTAPNCDPARDSLLAVDPAGEVVGWTYLDNPTGSDQEFVEVFVHPDRGNRPWRRCSPPSSTGWPSGPPSSGTRC